MIAGCGELHVEICLKARLNLELSGRTVNERHRRSAFESVLRRTLSSQDLRDEYAQCEFTVSDPVVSYRETVTETSSVCGLQGRSPALVQDVSLSASAIQQPINVRFVPLRKSSIGTATPT